VDGTELQEFEKRCKDRWFRELDEALEQPSLKPRRKLELEVLVERGLVRWEWALEVLKTIELNHRTVTEAYGAAGLAFRSRKTVESHAARYLTRYATEWDVFGKNERNDLGQQLQTRCAWNFSNDVDWKECWILAIEMPRQALPGGDAQEVLDAQITLRSLSALFRQPKRDIRPNELIYRAWYLFELDDLLLRQRLFLVNGQLKYGQELGDAERLKRGRQLLLPGADAVLTEFRRILA